MTRQGIAMARMTRAFGRMMMVMFAGTLATSAAIAQVVVPTTREEIQRDRLEDQLRAEGQPVDVGGDIERAPCPLADPQFNDLRFTFSRAEFTGLEAVNASIVAPAYSDLVGRELPVSAICDIRDRAGTILRGEPYHKG